MWACSFSFVVQQKIVSSFQCHDVVDIRSNPRRKIDPCMATIRAVRAVLCLHHESFHLFIRLLDEGAFGLASAIISALASQAGAQEILTEQLNNQCEGHGLTIGRRGRGRGS